jgi:hypothetical protein
VCRLTFQASFNGKEFDNCFTTPNAYYYRVGSETILRVSFMDGSFVNYCNMLRAHSAIVDVTPLQSEWLSFLRVTSRLCHRVDQGLDLAVQNMRVGDLWKLTVPASLAFGDKGTKASAGKPRIPGAHSLRSFLAHLPARVFPTKPHALLLQAARRSSTRCCWRHSR